MRAIINFIIKQHAFFLFLVLQALAFYLIVQNNSYHKASFLNSSNFISGNILETSNNIGSYFRLKEENENLAKQLQTLQNQQLTAFRLDTNTIVKVGDSLTNHQYVYTSAKVINSTIQFKNNFITLNKGSKHGIVKNSAVVTANGVLGIVKEVSENYAVAMSLLNQNIKIPAKIKRLNANGFVVWEENDPQIASMIDVLEHIKLQVGDTISTNAYSSIFPVDIPIGIVEDFELPSGEGKFKIKIRLLNDFKSLSYVLVIKDLYKAERLKLENSISNE